MLIGQSGITNCCQGIIEMTRTGFFFFPFSLQRTSHDLENNRKMILTKNNQSLHSWELSQPPQYAHTKGEPQLPSRLAGSSKKPLLIVEARLKITYLDFIKISIELNFDSTGSSEILG